MGPYGEGVAQYAQAGWSGIIPIRKHTKVPALKDVTGYTGHQLTPEESIEYAKARYLSSCNLGLRLPKGVIGVDVDDYDNKVGATTLARLEEELGPLPQTFYSSARGSGISGIRLYRVPPELEFEHVFGPDIEALRFEHRFAVVYPSVHPKTGTTYTWYNPNGTLLGGVPSPDDIATLPQAWVDRFGHEPRVRRENGASFEGVEDFFNEHSSGDMFRYLEAAKRIFDSSGGSRHDSMLKAVGCAMRDAAAGMYPAREAVDQLKELWDQATDGEGRGSEFEDLVERACSDAATEEVDLYRQGLVNPEEAVTVLEEMESGPVIVFETDDPSAVIYLSEFVPEGHSVTWSKNVGETNVVDNFSNRDVYVFMSKDPARDLNSYTRAEAFANELIWVESRVLFPFSPQGVYETMKKQKSDEVRRARFKKQLESATPKPAKAKPRSNEGNEIDLDLVTRNFESTAGNRTIVYLSGDRKVDNDEVTYGVKKMWDGKKVFSYGGVISRVKDDVVMPQDKGMWMNTIVEACLIGQKNSKGIPKAVEPPGYVVTSTLSRAEHFTPLEGIRHAPFIRKDGTVCQEPGYDDASRMKLVLSDSLSGISVPENPTKEEAVAAREYLEEWLYDFRKMMPTDADKANVLALLITPFIRGSVPVVPLAVVNGLQHGVGKNKLANGIATVYTGKTLIPKTFSTDDEEQRKQLMSIFKEGHDFICYDEARTIAGKGLAQALTVTSWSDRILGQSQIAEYPNNATWMSLGNNVRVEGDCIRRVYEIRLHPTSPNPENRKASDFRYPDFEARTARLRKEILEAVLTMIRGWYAAGSPPASKESSFGSFEVWESLVRGVLEYAGVQGFLENLETFRGESSISNELWVAHFDWLKENFGDEAFTTADVHEQLINAGMRGEAPPGMEDTSPKGYNRELGKVYSRIRDQFKDGFKLTKLDTHRNRSTLWKIEKVS